MDPNNNASHKKRITSPSKRQRAYLNAYGIFNTSNVKQSTRKLAEGALGQQNLSRSSSDARNRIMVCVRKKPLSPKELAKGDTDIIKVYSGRLLRMSEPKVRVDLNKYIEVHEFAYDEVFDSNATNHDVYKRTAYRLVDHIFTGGKATCFAYGQTGSGKTYTMLHPQNGIYAMAARDIFKKIADRKQVDLSVVCSFYEIYQGHLYDLLNSRTKLFAREDANQNVRISNLKDVTVTSATELFRVFSSGNNSRTTGVTGTNSDSSRSHAILQIVIKNTGSDNVLGKLSFIDLAGSERGGERGDVGKQTRIEGSEINKSLLALKECIRALDQDSKHTPFRQSKLTQVLKDSFIGKNTRTCMIATISPSLSNSEHTLNTLRYADRVKEINPDSPSPAAAISPPPNDDTLFHHSKAMECLQTPSNYELLSAYPDEQNLFDEEMPESMSYTNDISNPFPPTPDRSIYNPTNSVADLNRTPSRRNSIYMPLFNTPSINNSSDWATSSPCNPKTIKSYIKDINIVYQVHSGEMLELKQHEDALFAEFSKILASLDNDKSTGLQQQNSNNKNNSSFSSHVWHLDDIMEKKIQSVMAVRKKLKELLVNSKIGLTS